MSRKNKTIESLLDDKQWDTAQKRLEGIKSPKRIGRVLFHAIDDPNVPDDIFETLLNKLDGKREYHVSDCGFLIKEIKDKETTQPSPPRFRRPNEYGYEDVDRRFWYVLCNYSNWNFRKGKTFRDLILNRSVSTLWSMMERYANLVGPINMYTAKCAICMLWRNQLFGLVPSVDHSSICSVATSSTMKT